MIFTDKKEIRTYIKNVIPKDLETIKEKSKIINDKIHSSMYYKESSIVLSYMALNDEVFIDNEKLKENKTLYIPKVIMETNDLDFYKYEKNLSLGSYNILEPNEESDMFLFNKREEKILVIVPGRAFTKEGCRMGRGKGYYDRFLTRLLNNFKKENITLMGIGFKEQIIKEIVLEDHDIKMDLVITD